jgi:hypothetical protein
VVVILAGAVTWLTAVLGVPQVASCRDSIDAVFDVWLGKRDVKTATA